MKMSKIIFLAIAILSCTVCWAQDFENPGVYNEYINKQQENVVKKFLSYNSAIAHGKNARKVEKQRTKLMDEVQESRMNIASMPSFKGDKSFRDSAANFLKLYFNVLNEDFSKIVNMEEIAEQSYDLMEAYIMAQEKVQEKLADANKRMREVQMKFANNNNMRIANTEDGISNMMKEVAATNEYHHKVYLVFFKSYKQELYLGEALQKGDVNAIEQNKSALLSTVKEGQGKLEQIGAFNGDMTLINACKKLLAFYQKEAEEKMPLMVDYFMKKDKFASLKKEMDKKGDKRTQQDVDNFNAAVKDINTAGAVYNDNAKLISENLNNLLKEWNGAVEDFFRNHTPKYKD